MDEHWSESADSPGAEAHTRQVSVCPAKAMR
jgi:hypothetical protein